MVLGALAGASAVFVGDPVALLCVLGILAALFALSWWAHKVTNWPFTHDRRAVVIGLCLWISGLVLLPLVG